MLAQSQRTGAPARVDDSTWLREAHEDLAALSRRIPGSDFALVSWYGAAPFDVSDGQHLAVMNRSSQPIQKAGRRPGGQPGHGGTTRQLLHSIR